MVVVYINSDKLISDIESIMEYHRFNIIESNSNYRVFVGYFNGGPGKLTASLNTELCDADFDIGDSIFLIYPVISTADNPSLSNIIIKRKGNKRLRNFFLHKT